MSAQPKALEMANWLLNGEPYNVAPQAAAELRRLHEVNARLMEALKKCSEQLTRLGYSANHADAAITKAEGSAT